MEEQTGIQEEERRERMYRGRKAKHTLKKQGIVCGAGAEGIRGTQGGKGESFPARASNVGLLPLMVFLGIFSGPTAARQQGYRTHVQQLMHHLELPFAGIYFLPS